MDTIQPDSETQKRIKNLSIVGRIIGEGNNDNSGQSDVFLAKTALKEFEEGILKLNLDPESLEGIKTLNKFLETILDKKMQELN